jgi:hypothetical protein
MLASGSFPRDSRKVQIPNPIGLPGRESAVRFSKSLRGRFLATIRGLLRGDLEGYAAMTHLLDSLPRRIFLDSCTAQTLGNYGGHIFEGEPVVDSDPIHRIPAGVSDLEALRNIFLVNERALFEWIVSRSSMQEAADKRDPRHMRWLWDIGDHSEACLEDAGSTPESLALAARLDESKFGYLSRKDRLLIQDAIALRCEAFLTVERRLPRNAPHIEREVGIRILTPVGHWQMLQPWAALWR